MALPKEWPVLTAKNMEIGPYHSAPDCGCLQYWEAVALGGADPTFGPDESPVVRRVDRILCDAAEILTGQRFHTTLFGERVRGDDPLTREVPARRHLTRPLLARVWNLAGALLGYVRGNPEAKTAAAMKRKRGKKVKK